MTMSADEIRALYVEALAQHRSGMGDYYWHVIGPTMRAEYCKAAEPDVDALDAAGLLPVGAEWGYGCGIAGCGVDQCESTIHENAARLSRRGGPLWLRYFTDWAVQEVTE